MTKATKQSSSIIISDSTVLSKLIKSIATRGRGLDKDIHIAAVSALAHGFEHGSTAHAETLMAAMPKSARGKALQVYLMDLGCFMVKEDGKTLGINKDKRTAGFTTKAQALSTPFWEYTKDIAPPSPVEAMELVRNLIKRLQKAHGEGLLDDSSVLDKLLQVAPAVIADGSTEVTTEAPAKAEAETI